MIVVEQQQIEIGIEGQRARAEPADRNHGMAAFADAAVRRDEIRRADAHDVGERGVREIRIGARRLAGVQLAEQQPCGDPVPAMAADVVPGMKMIAAVGGRGRRAIRTFAQNPRIVADRARERRRGGKQARERPLARRVEPGASGTASPCPSEPGNNMIRSPGAGSAGAFCACRRVNASGKIHLILGRLWAARIGVT